MPYAPITPELDSSHFNSISHIELKQNESYLSLHGSSVDPEDRVGVWRLQECFEMFKTFKLLHAELLSAIPPGKC